MSQAAQKMDTQQQIFAPSKETVARAHINAEKYEKLYKRSIDDPESFWAEMAQRIDWVKKPAKIKNVSYDAKNLSIKWYEDGVLNACHNCVDRHLPKRAKQTALIWEGDDPDKD